jgi:diguanylate cyclase (GGDEF)-like protein
LASARDLLSRTATVAGAQAALEGLINLAFTDPTTRLYNRRAFDEVAKLPLGLDGLVYGALMLDLTGFKRVNDEGTHAAGDAALGRVGKTLLAMCDASEQFSPAMPFRYGGDEFCILVPKTIFEEFVDPFRLSQLRWDDFTLQEKSLGFSASIGIADPDEDVGLVELVDRADRAAKLSKDRKDEPVRWAPTIGHESIVSPRKRCDACTATITVQIAQVRVVTDGFKMCPNCGGVLP